MTIAEQLSAIEAALAKGPPGLMPRVRLMAILAAGAAGHPMAEA